MKTLTKAICVALVISGAVFADDTGQSGVLSDGKYTGADCIYGWRIGTRDQRIFCLKFLGKPLSLLDKPNPAYTKPKPRPRFDGGFRTYRFHDGVVRCLPSGACFWDSI